MEPDLNEDGEDIVVTDKELFDQALNDTPAETTAEAPPTAEATTEEKSDRARDELGRYVKAEAKTEPETVEAPKVEVVKPEPKAEDHRVPLRELLDERERRQQVTRKLEQLEAWQQQVMSQQQQARQQAQNGQQPPNIFDNPDTYLNQRFVQPLQQWGQIGMMQVKDGLSREMANQQFTEQVVNDALNAMVEARHSPEGNFAYQQIMSSGHPYGALVKWHQDQKTRQEIGSDLKAYRQKLLDEAKADPTFQAEVVKLIQGSQKGSGRPPVVSLPPSLSSQPSSKGPTEEQGDMSDASLFRQAIR
jgi:hypothetical protein